LTKTEILHSAALNKRSKWSNRLDAVELLWRASYLSTRHLLRVQ